ncbi:SMP-30/gluconolactonase/LRE family protein [soil metagenome]
MQFPSRLFLLFLLFLLLAVTAPSAHAEPDYPIPPEAVRHEGVPAGELIRGTFSGSAIFPGTEREYAVSIPAQLDPAQPAAIMVFQDGNGFCREDGGARAHIVFDNLIHAGEMPVTVGLFIQHGIVPAPHDQAMDRFNRSFEYDGLGDAYARFLIDEMIPFVEDEHGIKISDDPDRRGICGASSGAVAAFTAAWERPDSFRRVYSMIGTYVGLRGADRYPDLVRRTEPKPLRIFLQDGSDDLNIYAGDWWMANQTMLRALQWAGYEVKHAWGEGAHNHLHGAAIFPDAMRWLWATETVSTHLDQSRSRAAEYLVATGDWEVVSTGHQWAEGMAVTADGTLFFTDVPAGKLYKVSLGGEQSLVDGDTGNTNGIALGPDGKIYGAASGAQEIRSWDPASGTRETVASGTASNDLVVRHDGRIYYTDPQAGKVWHLAPGTRERTEADSFENPNGIALSADQTLLFVADFAGRFIYSYQIQDDGHLASKQPFFYALLPADAPRGHLDGMCSTTTGELVAATEAGIQIFDQPGRVQLVLPRPAPGDGRTNYVTFGGADRKTLYAATRQTVYRRGTKLQGADPTSPNKPPKPGL